MEKSIFTPEQYPLTVNALTNACNQKSGRNPVLTLEPGQVQRAAEELNRRHLIKTEENFRSGVHKYSQRFCNTAFSEYQFDQAQFAVICLLLLRGPQTPGELRARSGRLYKFADNDTVVDALNSLIERDGDPLVTRLPITPGRRDSEYTHLFSGEMGLESHAEIPRTRTTTKASERVTLSDLAKRVEALETELALIKEKLAGS